MAKLQKIVGEHRSHSNGNSTTEFSKKSGIIYCLSCGKECSCESSICINEKCGKSNFLTTNISEIVGGYIELAKKDKLKTYYHSKSRYSKSLVRMNNKRMIHHLITHSQKINIKKEIIDKIYNANIQ